MSKKNSDRSIEITVSKSDYERIAREIEDGTLDPSTITMKEWLDVSFLSLFNGHELHLNESMFHGGNLYKIHACVEGVVPNQPVPSISRKQ